MLRDYSKMSKAELSSELKSIKSDLEDLEETSEFYLTNAAVHIPGRTVAKYDDEIRKLKEEIVMVEKLLAE
jgi:hypothetical protein